MGIFSSTSYEEEIPINFSDDEITEKKYSIELFPRIDSGFLENSGLINFSRAERLIIDNLNSLSNDYKSEEIILLNLGSLRNLAKNALLNYKYGKFLTEYDKNPDFHPKNIREIFALLIFKFKQARKIYADYGPGLTNNLRIFNIPAKSGPYSIPINVYDEYVFVSNMLKFYSPKIEKIVIDSENIYKRSLEFSAENSNEKRFRGGNDTFGTVQTDFLVSPGNLTIILAIFIVVILLIILFYQIKSENNGNKNLLASNA